MGTEDPLLIIELKNERHKMTMAEKQILIPHTNISWWDKVIYTHKLGVREETITRPDPGTTLPLLGIWEAEVGNDDDGFRPAIVQRELLHKQKVYKPGRWPEGGHKVKTITRVVEWIHEQ